MCGLINKWTDKLKKEWIHRSSFSTSAPLIPWAGEFFNVEIVLCISSIPDLCLLDASNSRPPHTLPVVTIKMSLDTAKRPPGQSVLESSCTWQFRWSLEIRTWVSVLVLHFLHYDLDLLRSKFKSQSSQKIPLKPHLNNRVNRSVIYGVKCFFNSNTKSKGRPSLNQLIWFTRLLFFK